MKKEVFTQEFEKCFTVFQQVELLKKYINELDIESIETSVDNLETSVDNLETNIDNIERSVDNLVTNLNNKLDKTTTFTDQEGKPYEGETGWVLDDDKLFYETKIRSTQPGVYDNSAYFYMGEDAIHLDSNHINLVMDDNDFSVNCEAYEGYSINGIIDTNDQSSVGITAGNNTLKVTSDNGLLYNSEPLTLKSNLVASGTYIDSQLDYQKRFRLSSNLKPFTFYYLITHDDESSITTSCIFCTSKSTATYGLNILKIVDIDDNYVDASLTISIQGAFPQVIISSLSGVSIYKSENDELEIYELPFTLNAF